MVIFTVYLSMPTHISHRKKKVRFLFKTVITSYLTVPCPTCDIYVSLSTLGFNAKCSDTEQRGRYFLHSHWWTWPFHDHLTARVSLEVSGGISATRGQYETKFLTFCLFWLLHFMLVKVLSNFVYETHSFKVVFTL